MNSLSMVRRPLIATVIVLFASCGAFTSKSLTYHHLTPLYASSLSENWIPLVESSNRVSPVQKLILEEGEGEFPSDGCSVELEYNGTLVSQDWSELDVVECWLSKIQGCDHLVPSFLENNIDFTMLTDENVFTEEYCASTLGISNKIQAKKLVMAAKRISKSQADHPPGTVFDSSKERGKNFSFDVGGGKAIKGIDLAVREMRVGEDAYIVCRSDYAYDSEGLRSIKGDVIVPPFATIKLELKRIR